MRIPLSINNIGGPITIQLLIDPTRHAKLMAIAVSNHEITTEHHAMMIQILSEECVEANFGPCTGITGDFPDFRYRDYRFQIQTEMTRYVNALRAKVKNDCFPAPQKFRKGEGVYWMRGSTRRTGTFLTTTGVYGKGAKVTYKGTPIHVPLHILRPIPDDWL